MLLSSLTCPVLQVSVQNPLHLSGKGWAALPGLNLCHGPHFNLGSWRSYLTQAGGQVTRGGVAPGTSCSAFRPVCWQGARPQQLPAPPLLRVPGDQGRAAPAAASAAAAAPGLPAALLRRGLQLHSGQQLCQVLLPHAEVHQRAPPHLEAPPGLQHRTTSPFTRVPDSWPQVGE